MPFSTSLNSTSAVPLASSKCSRSLSGKFQLLMLAVNGNCVTQFGSNSILRPPGTTSPLKVTEQTLSRSALENSQVPITPFAELPSCGACASAIDGRKMAATAMTKRIMGGSDLTTNYTPPRGYRLGGHGVSGTGVSGGFPPAQAKMLSTTS